MESCSSKESWYPPFSPLRCFWRKLARDLGKKIKWVGVTHGWMYSKLCGIKRTRKKKLWKWVSGHFSQLDIFTNTSRACVILLENLPYNVKRQILEREKEGPPALSRFAVLSRIIAWANQIGSNASFFLVFCDEQHQEIVRFSLVILWIACDRMDQNQQ